MSTRADGQFAALRELGERGRAVERGRGADPYPRATGSAPSIEQLRARRDEIDAVAKRRGARSLRVFGSVARGQARPDSDLDVLAELDEHRGLLEQAGLQGDLERLLGCRVQVVTVSALRRAREAVRGQIEREALRL